MFLPAVNTETQELSFLPKSTPPVTKAADKKPTSCRTFPLECRTETELFFNGLAAPHPSHGVLELAGTAGRWQKLLYKKCCLTSQPTAGSCSASTAEGWCRIAQGDVAAADVHDGKNIWCLGQLPEQSCLSVERRSIPPF